MTRYSMEPRARKYVKGYASFCHSTEDLDSSTKTGLDAAKTASKR